MRWKTQLGLVLSLIISQKHAYEIFITELLGAEIKEQMAEPWSCCHSPPAASRLLHRRQVTKYPRGTRCPWEAHAADSAVLALGFTERFPPWSRAEESIRDRGRSPLRWSPLRWCAAACGCACNFCWGFLKTAYRVPEGRCGGDVA